MERQLVMFDPARPLVEQFGAEFFRQVPERPGVYLMCGAGEGVLYVGKAKNLRQRLASYRSANLDRAPRRLRRLLCAVERILWDECATETAALERERELLRAMQPRFNRVGVRPATPDCLGWRLTDGRLAVGLGEKMITWPECHGPDAQCRWLHGALLRSLWWALHPTLGWEQMPSRLRRDKVPAVWEFAVDGDQVEEVRLRLGQLFRGKSPELVEWCVWSAARRPQFERAWAGRDALCLLEFYERLTGSPERVDEEVPKTCSAPHNPEFGIAPNRCADALFPLTPTLSPWERESLSPRLRKF